MLVTELRIRHFKCYKLTFPVTNSFLSLTEIYVFVYVCMYLCIYVCIYLSIYLSIMYVCMYVHIVMDTLLT